MRDPALRERLNGAWRLESFVFTDAAGGTIHPLGPNPSGFLFVTAVDHVAFNFMASDRPRFASDDLFGGAPGELAAAAKAVVSFAGPFRIDGETMIVEVRYSLYPNWIGKTQVRSFELAGERLVLRTVRAMPFAGSPRLAEARLVRA
jgi:hypothetical protein